MSLVRGLQWEACRRLYDSKAPAGAYPGGVEPLTKRDEQVLVKVASGLSNSEIAGELYITLSKAKTHVASLMTKLGARNRVEVAIWAHETRRRR